VAQSPALFEDGIHEPVRGAVDLPLGERPELDRLDAAGQRVRQAAQRHHARRPGEQVAAGPGVGVDLLLDGEQEVRHALDLVDHHQSGGIHEAGRIGGRRWMRGEMVTSLVVIWSLRPPGRENQLPGPGTVWQPAAVRAGAVG